MMMMMFECRTVPKAVQKGKKGKDIFPAKNEKCLLGLFFFIVTWPCPLSIELPYSQKYCSRTARYINVRTTQV